MFIPTLRDDSVTVRPIRVRDARALETELLENRSWLRKWEATSPVGPDGRIAIDVSDLTVSNPAKVAPGVMGSDGFGVIITRISATEYKALSMRCTHQSCTVDSRLSNGEIHCACHNSNFRVDGTVSQGPATVALTSYDVTFDATAHVVHAKLA